MGERAINLNQQLNYIEQLFSSGQIKKAQKDLRKLNTQFGRDKPIPSKFKHRFQRLNFTAKEFDDWAEFATSDKRTELINKVGSLSNQKLGHLVKNIFKNLRVKKRRIEIKNFH